MSDPRPPLSVLATQRLLVDTEPYLSCDDCFALVDTYVEDLLIDPAHDRPSMRIHLAGCVACAEEARSLVEIVAADSGKDPGPALEALAR